MQLILSKDKIQVESNTKSLLNLYCRNAAYLIERYKVESNTKSLLDLYCRNAACLIER